MRMGELIFEGELTTKDQVKVAVPGHERQVCYGHLATHKPLLFRQDAFKNTQDPTSLSLVSLDGRG